MRRLAVLASLVTILVGVLVSPAAAHGTSTARAKFISTFGGGLETLNAYNDSSNTENHPEVRCTIELLRRTDASDPWNSIEFDQDTFTDVHNCQNMGVGTLRNCAREYKAVATIEVWGFSQGWHEFQKDSKIKSYC